MSMKKILPWLSWFVKLRPEQNQFDNMVFVNEANNNLLQNQQQYWNDAKRDGPVTMACLGMVAWAGQDAGQDGERRNRRNVGEPAE